MPTLSCVTCGGIYDDVGPDGLRYFHTCPPFSRDELAAAVAAGTVTLRRNETVDEAFAVRSFPRPDARDENIDRAKVAATRAPDGTRPRGLPADTLMKALGRGVIVVPESEREGRGR